MRHYKKIYLERMRCPLCGYIINDQNRFEWDHHFQTFEVVFGSVKGQKGRGLIRYTEIPNPEYISTMRAAVIRLAKRLGLTIVEQPSKKKTRK